MSFCIPNLGKAGDKEDSLVGRTAAAVSIHSYGNVLLYPWGYTDDDNPHPDGDRFLDPHHYLLYWQSK